jgi:hypothetical protein
MQSEVKLQKCVLIKKKKGEEEWRYVLMQNIAKAFLGL